MLYDAVRNCLGCSDYEELPGDAGGGFVEEVQSCMDADEVPMSVFIFSLLIERYKGKRCRKKDSVLRKKGR